MVPLPGAACRQPVVYPGRMNTTILWHDCKTLGTEHCTVTSGESGFQFSGAVLCPVEGVPLQSAYTVTVDANWRTRHVAVHVETPHTHARVPAVPCARNRLRAVHVTEMAQATVVSERLERNPPDPALRSPRWY